MVLLLAPMEGLLDHALRDVLTRIGGIDRCVSEFIRVTDTLLPERAFVRTMPELLNGSRTPAGVPVRGQLLGSDPVCLADNAARLAQLGSAGVDLNFGCPARVVNRHGGGAALLEEPELLHRIVSAVRRAVPAAQPVSAKMRLGLHDDRRAEECAQAIAEAGAAEIVVHARTKADGYRPPAYWARVADLRAAVRIPLIANGEIWNVSDAARCRAESGCESLMLGRGIVTDPGLALAIRAGATAADRLPWPTLLPLLRHYWDLTALHVTAKHRPGRIKQWLKFLRSSYAEADAAYTELRTVNEPAKLQAWLEAQTGALQKKSLAME
ncbi:MAG: hypothetical protein RJA44_877 [Pseudomonadota bacterium]|jgi:tRNA-dihydrouridine synthase C